MIYKTSPTLTVFVKYGIADAICDHRNKYNISFYKAYVWDGLSDDFPDLYDQATIDDWITKRIILKADLSTFKCK